MTAAVDDDGAAAAVELVRRAGCAVGDDAPRRAQLESLARSQPVSLAGHQAQIVGQDVLGGLAASARERRHEDARDPLVDIFGLIVGVCVVEMGDACDSRE